MTSTVAIPNYSDDFWKNPDREGYIGAVHRLIARDLNGRVPRADLEDLSQRATLKFMERITRNGPEGIESPSGYAVMVGRNLAKDHLAARERHSEIPAGSAADLDIAAGTAVFQELPGEQEERTELMELVAKIAPTMAEAINLLLQGHSIPEIASITNQKRDAIYFAFRKIALALDPNVLRSAVRSQVDDSDDDDAIVDIFKTLGKRQAQVLLLSAEGHKPRAIARTLGIGGGAVRASKSIAIRTIRQAVGEVSTEEIMETLLKHTWRGRAGIA